MERELCRALDPPKLRVARPAFSEGSRMSHATGATGFVADLPRVYCLKPRYLFVIDLSEEELTARAGYRKRLRID